MLVPILLAYSAIGALIATKRVSAMNKRGKIGMWDSEGNPIGERPVTFGDDAKLAVTTTVAWPLVLLMENSV